MNGSVQRTIPDVMLPFRSMIPKSRSAAYYGSEYQLPHYAATDILPSRSALWPAYMPPSPTSKCSKTSKIKPSPKMGLGFSYGPDDWFRSRMGWGLSPFTAGTEAEYQLPHYAAVDIPRREKGETSWREASCFDSGDVKHEAERKNRVDGGGRSGVVQGAGGGSCERFRDRGDQRRLGISTEPKWFS